MEGNRSWGMTPKFHTDEGHSASPTEPSPFVQALLGKPVVTEEAIREFVDAILPMHHRRWKPAQQCRGGGGQVASAAASNDARLFAKALRGEGVVTDEEVREFVRAITSVDEGTWNPADHPRAPKGQPGGGRWVNKDGAGGSAGTEISPTFLDALIRRNQMIADLTGVVTPGMIRSNGIARELQSAARLPGEIARWASDVARAAAAGLGTGGKAVVNGFATAVKSVATLGLNTSQLELIGVTKEDRARGYDTAVAISTASGQVLIAVGTGGITSALSKGGSVARAASGALILYDAAGNAVGVVQGVYDATQNGVDISNGTRVAGGLLGLGANTNAARGLKSSAAFPMGFDPLRGFATFEDFKDAFGAAGPGQAWHHVVEQTINSGKFAAEILHNPANLFKLPHGKGSIHAKISGYYSSTPWFTGGLTVRRWLSKKSFKEQFEFGIQTIKRFGGAQYLPPHLR